MRLGLKRLLDVAVVDAEGGEGPSAAMRGGYMLSPWLGVLTKIWAGAESGAAAFGNPSGASGAP
jgi:hypothetical protein